MKTRFPVAALFLLCVFAQAWLPSRAQAQFSFTLSPATLSGAPGDTLTFFGTLTNSGNTSLASNRHYTLTLLSGPVGADLTAFQVDFAGIFAPNTLAPGTTEALPLFALSIDPATPLGQYGANFTLGYGGSTAGQDLFVNVAQPQAVPEAGTGAVLALGLLCLAVLFTRRVRAAAPTGTVG